MERSCICCGMGAGMGGVSQPQYHYMTRREVMDHYKIKSPLTLKKMIEQGRVPKGESLTGSNRALRWRSDEIMGAGS